VQRLVNAPCHFKKQIMKFILIPLLSTLLFIAGCKKPASSGKVNGVITGFDASKCGCCWGAIIAVDGKTYRIESVPAASGIDLFGSYPINVSLSYTFQQGCNEKVIVSADIRRR
jgi:hypothetical protein